MKKILYIAAIMFIGIPFIHAGECIVSEQNLGLEPDGNPVPTGAPEPQPQEMRSCPHPQGGTGIQTFDHDRQYMEQKQKRKFLVTEFHDGEGCLHCNESKIVKRQAVSIIFWETRNAVFGPCQYQMV